VTKDFILGQLLFSAFFSFGHEVYSIIKYMFDEDFCCYFFSSG